MKAPVYIRLGRLATPVFHDAERYTFQIGKGEQLTTAMMLPSSQRASWSPKP